MDTSEQYIQMSVQAWPELRRELQWGDAVYSLSRELVGRVGYSLDGAGKPQLAVTRGESCILTDADDWVVVFRQDQLQEMMSLSDRQLMKQFRDFLVWATGVKLHDRYNTGENPPATMLYGIFLPSFEQLWLAFVMKEKYNKTWDGESWQ